MAKAANSDQRVVRANWPTMLLRAIDSVQSWTWPPTNMKTVRYSVQPPKKPRNAVTAIAGAASGRTTRMKIWFCVAPSSAVTAFLGFLGGWTEYLTVFMFVGGQ